MCAHKPKTKTREQKDRTQERLMLAPAGALSSGAAMQRAGPGSPAGAEGQSVDLCWSHFWEEGHVVAGPVSPLQVAGHVCGSHQAWNLLGHPEQSWLQRLQGAADCDALC